MSVLLKPGLAAIDRHVKLLDEQLLNGSCKDFTEYKAKVAERSGLLKAVRLIKETTGEDPDD